MGLEGFGGGLGRRWWVGWGGGGAWLVEGPAPRHAPPLQIPAPNFPKPTVCTPPLGPRHARGPASPRKPLLKPSRIDPTPRFESTPQARGTRVVLHLKEDAAELADPIRLARLIKQYSQFIQFPIKLYSATKEPKQVGGLLCYWGG